MWKKGLIAGCILFVAGFVINAILSAVFPSLAAEYQNTAIFRPWTDPLMFAYLAYPFILGVILSYVWIRVSPKRGKNTAKSFATLYFIIATFPGMFISFTSIQVSFGLVLIWTITGFIQSYIAGLVFERG